MIHHIYANRTNIGDWLSALGIQSLLAPQPVVEHLCDEPFVAETLAALSACTSKDLIVIGGGGLFMDYFTPFWEGFRPIAGRVPFCIWGIGYCDLKREVTLAPTPLLAEIVRKSRLCVVRDELSRRHLAHCNLPAPVPCPSINIVQVPEQSGYGLLHVDNYTTAGAEVFEYMDAQGKAYAQSTNRPYRRTNNRIMSDSKKGLATTLALYAGADMVISSALHGCIIAVAMGRKVLAVSGDYKIEGFMELAGLGDWVLDIREVQALPDLLAKLPYQGPCDSFVTEACQANQLVGAKIIDILGQL